MVPSDHGFIIRFWRGEMLKVVLYLDEESKHRVKIDSALLNSDEVSIVSSLQDVQEEMLDESRRVVALDGALHTGARVKGLQFYRDVLSLQLIFLLAEKKNAELCKGLGRVYGCNTSVLDYELLQASIYDDASQKEEKTDESTQKLALEVQQGNGSAEEKILANEYLKVIEREQVLIKRVAELQEQLDTIVLRNAILSEQNRKWADGCRELIRRAVAQNENLARFETVFSQDIYAKLMLSHYPNKPLILYLKVFTDFVGMNAMIETLVDVYRYQMRKSVKVLNLYDGSGDRAIRLLPDYYYRVHNYYAMEEVVNNNYLCKSGDYNNLLDRLLTNKYGLDVLILVDCKDHDDMVVQGLCLQYNLCRTVRQAQILSLAQNNTIINQKMDGWLQWVPANVEKLTEKERFVKLSSRKAIQEIVKRSEKYIDAF